MEAHTQEYIKNLLPQIQFLDEEMQSHLESCLAHMEQPMLNTLGAQFQEYIQENNALNEKHKTSYAYVMSPFVKKMKDNANEMTTIRSEIDSVIQKNSEESSEELLQKL